MLICHYSLTKKSIIQFRRDVQKTWMKHARIDSDNVDLHRVLLVWDGMGLPYLLPQDFIKQWLEGKLILSNMRSILFITLLVFSSWEQCEIIPGKAIEFLFLWFCICTYSHKYYRYVKLFVKCYLVFVIPYKRNLGLNPPFSTCYNELKNTPW